MKGICLRSVAGLVFCLSLLPTIFAAEGKPSAEWIRILESMPEESATVEELMRGCYYRVTTRPILISKLLDIQCEQSGRASARWSCQGLLK